MPKISAFYEAIVESIIWGVLLMTTVSTTSAAGRDYNFDGKISRNVLENYLSRSITMMDLLSGVGDVDDNIRMLKDMGAKFAGRSLCLIFL